MKILFVLNYYYPYISGVSEYARLLAEQLVNEGHECTVVCSNHEKLKQEEVINGVKVLRAPIICKISKGTVSLSYIRWAKKLAKEADVVNFHMPMLESGLISSIIDKKKLIATFQCDINLPNSLMNNFIVKVMDFSNKLCLKNAQKIVVTSIDYANNSRIAAKFKDKLVETPTPLKLVEKSEVQKPEGIKTIGFCGRIVEEKGIDVLLKAFHIIQKQRSDIRLVIGGDYKNIVGGSIYPQLMEYVKANNIKNVEFIGKIPEADMGKFYCSLDVLTLPSINSLEAFGMVQIEAMMCGVPVVASDLPGVRTIVGKTGMGLVCKRKDPQSLADCILKVLDGGENYIKSNEFIRTIYGTDITVADYMKCFKEITKA